ncbi:hypothetical protein [Streptomyces sp. NBC_00091]|uniref:hypothetical protein n=1 Tax=Streptomyces sp. NBC_00091 TaxID=2975648 RepID=UPI00225B2910|nr:hypothetical protein [Streptomyces sp. NBC_00091]MCX5381555.1 hypothetical protein [Streptomyces sp. NBC_00091]
MSTTAMTSFDEVYGLPDPRGYFTRLQPYAYQTPAHAQPVFRALAGELPAGRRTVLDVCCSYGINAALLNHELTLDDLYAHYTSEAAARLSTAELIDRDREFYAERRRPDAVPVIGLDVSGPAVSYALAVGLLEEGYAQDLEASEPEEGLRRSAPGVGLITVTGGTSFLTGRTFARLLTAVGRPVPVAAFVLRTHDYRDIARCLESYGLRVERAGSTSPQRRFTDPEEQRLATAAVTALGEDPAGKEAAGWFHTRLHLARPRPGAQPLPEARS